MIRSMMAALCLLGAASTTAKAEVVSSSDSGFVLSHEATSTLAPDALFARMMDPSRWWDPEHSYSGKATNISMGNRAGDHWREDWAGGSVIHGEVLQVINGQMLMLSAPFGPLAATGAECIWTIRLTPTEDGGTKVMSSHVVVGGSDTGLASMAGPVDFVMGNGITRLAGE